MAKSKILRMTIEVEAGGVKLEKSFACNIGNMEPEAAESMLATSARIFLRKLEKAVSEKLISNQLG